MIGPVFSRFCPLYLPGTFSVRGRSKNGGSDVSQWIVHLIDQDFRVDHSCSGKRNIRLSMRKKGDPDTFDGLALGFVDGDRGGETHGELTTFQPEGKVDFSW